MWSLLKKEIVLSLREGSGLSLPLLFYISILIAAPFAIGPDPQLLAKIGSALLWIGMLFSCLLGLDRLFRPDNQDGTLDQYLLSSSPIVALVFTKSLVHWLTNALPLVVVSPLFGLVLTMETKTIFATFLTLLVGSPALSFIGALGAALTVSLPRSGLLVSVLVLPFCLPVLIFGVGSVQNMAAGGFTPSFLVLCALSLFFMGVAPLFAALALRHRS